MSRKWNSLDKGMVESFFGILKSKMFYCYEKVSKSLEQLKQVIVEYIDYYDNKRIKVKLKLSSQGTFHQMWECSLARKILFKCILNITSDSYTNPCHIADFCEKRKRQSEVTSTKPHTIASIHRLIITS